MTEQRRVCPKALPPAPVIFAGRIEELRRYKERIKKEPHTSFLITGPGGIGKTSLVKKLAHELSDEGFFQATLWATISRQPEPLDLLKNWGCKADVKFDPTLYHNQEAAAEHVKDLLIELINEKCQSCDTHYTLVVLDDVWPESEEVAELLQKACPDKATILITGRKRELDIPAAYEDRLTQLALNDAVALLNRLLQHSLFGLNLSQLEDLAKRLGCFPLALEVVAKTIKHDPDPVEALSRQLDKFQRELPSGLNYDQTTSEEELEQKLGVVFSASFESLESVDQDYFVALGALPHDQSFSDEILLNLWSLSVERQAAIIRRRLLDYSLIEQSNTGNQAYYKLHPLLHSFAKNKFKRSANPQLFKARLQKLVIEKLKAFFNKNPRNKWEAQQIYQPAIEEFIEECLAFSLDNLDPTTLEGWLEFTRHAARYLEISDDQRRLQILEKGHLLSNSLNSDTDEAFFLSELGMFYLKLGTKDYDEIEEDYFQLAVNLYREGNSILGEALALTNLGGLYLLRKHPSERGSRTVENQSASESGDLDKFIIASHRAEELLEQLENTDDKVKVLIGLGANFNNAGDQEKARQLYERALTLLKNFKDESRELDVSRVLVSICEDLDNLKQAVYFASRCVKLGGENEYGNQRASLKNKFKIQLYERKYDELEPSNPPTKRIRIALQLANAYSNGDKKNYEAAADYYQEALELVLENNDTRQAIGIYLSIGRLQEKQINSASKLEGEVLEEELLKLAEAQKSLSGALEKVEESSEEANNMSSADKQARIDELSKQLGEAYNLLSQLERHWLVSSDPMRVAEFRLSIDETKNKIMQLEAALREAKTAPVPQPVVTPPPTPHLPPEQEVIGSQETPAPRPQPKPQLSLSERQRLIDIMANVPVFTNSPANFLRSAGIPRNIVRHMDFGNKGNDHLLAMDTVTQLEDLGYLDEPPFLLALTVVIKYLLESGIDKTDADFLRKLLFDKRMIPLPQEEAITNEENIQSLQNLQQRWRSAGLWEIGSKKIRTVCRIENSSEAIGTGFLVDSNLVLTNYHVLRAGKGTSPEQKARDLTFRFGYMIVQDRTDPGALFRAVNSGALVASDEVLDFALIRVNEVSISNFGNEANINSFGFVKLTEVRPAVKSEEIIVLQHPAAWDLQCSPGRILRITANRLYHNANTLHGSSGAPVFDADWKILALHRAGQQEGGAEGNVCVRLDLILPKIAEFLSY